MKESLSKLREKRYIPVFVPLLFFLFYLAFIPAFGFNLVGGSIGFGAFPSAFLLFHGFIMIYGAPVWFAIITYMLAKGDRKRKLISACISAFCAVVTLFILGALGNASFSNLKSQLAEEYPGYMQNIQATANPISECDNIDIAKKMIDGISFPTIIGLNIQNVLAGGLSDFVITSLFSRVERSEGYPDTQTRSFLSIDASMRTEKLSYVTREILLEGTYHYPANAGSCKQFFAIIEAVAKKDPGICAQRLQNVSLRSDFGYERSEVIKQCENFVETGGRF